MNFIKYNIAVLLLLLASCSFIELFDENNTVDIILFLLGTMWVSSILAFLLIKSVKS